MDAFQIISSLSPFSTTSSSEEEILRDAEGGGTTNAGCVIA